MRGNVLVSIASRFVFLICGALLWALPVHAQQGWSEVRTLAAPMVRVGDLGTSMAVDAEGNAMAFWIRVHDNDPNLGVAIESSRFVADTQTWTPPVAVLTAEGVAYPVAAGDPAGNVVIVWRHSAGGVRSIRSMRYMADSGTWTAPGRHLRAWRSPSLTDGGHGPRRQRHCCVGA